MKKKDILKNIGIIIPAYNEEKNIERLVNNINKYLDNPFIYIVDDSLGNKTSNIIKTKRLKVKYYHRKIKSGRGSAVLFALKKIIKNKKITAFIEMDADFSHNPNEMKKNLRLFFNEKCDLLISSRYMKGSKIINWPRSRKTLSKLSNILAKFLLKVPVSDYTNGYRIYSKRAAKLIAKKCGDIGDGFIVLSEILLMINLKKFKINETKTIFINRVRGQSSVNFKLIFQSIIGLFKLFLIKKFINIH
jgi:dolichol-phosphate mannosyltransferase